MRQSAVFPAVLAVMVLLVCLALAGPAVAQDCFPMSCNDPNQSGPATGQGIGGDSDIDFDGDGGGPGQSGSDGGDNADISTSGEPGTSQAGQPGSSGRIAPPAPPPAPRTSTSTRRSTSSGPARTTTSAVTNPSPEPSPSPTESPSPSPSPTESPSPTPTPSDLVTALQDADPASEDGSLVPFFAMVLGAILLFMYVRSRRQAGQRGGMRSTSRRRGGTRSF